MTDIKKDVDLPRFGKLAKVPWIKTAPYRAPTERDDRLGEIVYGVRTAKDLREAGRRLAKKSAV
jgi:hypothetical protein